MAHTIIYGALFLFKEVERPVRMPLTHQLPYLQQRPDILLLGITANEDDILRTTVAQTAGIVEIHHIGNHLHMRIDLPPFLGIALCQGYDSMCLSHFPMSPMSSKPIHSYPREIQIHNLIAALFRRRMFLNPQVVEQRIETVGLIHIVIGSEHIEENTLAKAPRTDEKRLFAKIRNNYSTFASSACFSFQR